MLWTLSRCLARKKGGPLGTPVGGSVRSFAEALGREFRMPSDSYDLVVIGTGSAASTVASRCRRAGWTVAVIGFRPYMV